MNDNEIKSNQDDKNIYRATSNLNTAIENPQININSAVGVNIKDVNSSDDMHSSNVINSNDYINGVNSSNFNYGESFTLSNSNQTFGDSNFNANSFINSQENFEQKFNSGNNNNSDSFDTSFSETQKSSQFIAGQFNSQVNDNDISTYTSSSSDEHVVYQPTMQDKKKKGIPFKVTRELKVTLFIVFILLLFVLLIPYIYDFFSGLQLFTVAR